VRHQIGRSRFALIAVAVATIPVCGALVQRASATEIGLAVPDRASIAAAVPPHVSRTIPERSLQLATPDWPTFRSSAGAPSITVRVSPTYPDPERTATRWVAFIAQLVHGDELDGLVLHLGTPDEVAEICGATGAVGCYSRGSSKIVSVGDESAGARPEAVVAHEYGHYIAAHRDNAPWKALDWGTKRWASQLRICSRARSNRVLPGDAGMGYSLNPGEAFAETYRLLNAQRFGGPEPDWRVVDRLFYPGKRALDAVRRDVLDPWARPTIVRLTGRLDAHGGARVTLSTPLDGTLLLEVAGATAAGEHVLRRTICGTRRTNVELIGTPHARFALTAARP
jgi:hypothetical protein